MRILILLACLTTLSTAVTAQCWGETAELLPVTGTTYYGFDVAVDGDTAVVGARTGEVAVVFERSGLSDWTETATLLANDPDAQAFGYSVAISGDTIVVGAPDSGNNLNGAAFVFERDLGGAGAWGQVKKLVPVGGQAFDRSGISVAISGDTLVLGSPGDSTPAGNGTGSAAVFDRNLGGAENWAQRKKVHPTSNFNWDFGQAVAISGDDLLVGAPNSGGAVFFFERDSGGNNQWGETQQITESGTTIGLDVSISGDTAVAGSYSKKAFVYERVGGETTWSQEAVLITPSNYPVYDEFAYSVATSGQFVAVGSAHEIGAFIDGQVFVYAPDSSGSGWGEGLLVQSQGVQPQDFFGETVSLSDNTMVVGASFHGNGQPGSSGSAYVFELTPVETYCTAGTSASGCQARISASGVPSASLSTGFCLRVQDVEGAKDGLFFYGINGRQANPWGNSSSFVCVVPPRVRGGLLVAAGSTAGFCDGTFSQDLNERWCATCPKPAHNYGAGAVVQAQFWYRDPHNTATITSSMSDALEFTMQP